MPLRGGSRPDTSRRGRDALTARPSVRRSMVRVVILVAVMCVTRGARRSRTQSRSSPGAHPRPS